MLILGLLLLAGPAAFTGLALADNLNGGPDYNVTMLGHHIATMNSLAIFCAGLALALIFGLGVMMAMGGLSLRRRKYRKLSTARRDAVEAARERDELAARLENGTTAEPAGYPAAGAAGNPAAGERERDLAANRGDLTSSGAARADQGPRHRRHLFGH
jgi:hypothetical protein